jgi:hypothetical protein
MVAWAVRGTPRKSLAMTAAVISGALGGISQVLPPGQHHGVLAQEDAWAGDEDVTVTGRHRGAERSA